MTEIDSKKVAAAKEAQGFKQRVRIKIRSFDHKIIDQSTKIIVQTVKRTGAQVYGPIPLPTEKRKYTVNSSTFVHKNARDQFEMRTHKRLMDIIEPSAATIEALSNLNLPTGVDIEIKM
ncbi:MAG: 30S ribosomal protein S10 [Candidatus Falkowbacteria bacterium]|nr:30S ribosomal protein S10 [Candidatus Falkowbacteria bacterium]